MKAFVTGGNGFLGAHLIRRLLSESFQVIVLIRKQSQLTELNGLNPLIYEEGDITNKASLVEALKRWQPDVVFHLAGFVGYKKSERSAMESITRSGRYAKSFSSSRAVEPESTRIVR